MPCYRPLSARKDSEGSIVFHAGSPTNFPGDNHLQLPCGQCIGCRWAKSREWALRCVHEASRHDRNGFLTLTYNDAHLPPDRSLDHRHWQLFAKRLRKRCGPFRFFMTGEYGDSTARPHYHAIIFGHDFREQAVTVRRKTSGEPLWTNPDLQGLWPKGYSSVGRVTLQSAAYVARYACKKLTGPAKQYAYSRMNPETGEIWEVKPEYVSMSRRPGLGRDWIDAFGSDVYPADELVHEGKKFRPPRYYDNQQSEELIERMKLRRREKVAARSEDLTPQRLEQRESWAASFVSHLDHLR